MKAILLAAAMLAGAVAPVRAENVPICYAVMGSRLIDLSSLCNPTPSAKPIPLLSTPTPPIAKPVAAKPTISFTTDEVEALANDYASRYCQFASRGVTTALDSADAVVAQAVMQKFIEQGINPDGKAMLFDGAGYEYLPNTWAALSRRAVAGRCGARY